MTTFLERYRNGEREQVWADLLACGEQVRREPLFSDANAVARETMIRAKQNITRLVERLQVLGYQFEYPVRSQDPREGSLLTPPLPDAADKLAGLERYAGVLPLSLRAWYEIVGGVCLLGRHPGWPDYAYTDPLYIASLDFLLIFHPEWSDPLARATAPISLMISPDDLHKAGFSGSTYDIMLPNPAVDAPLDREWHQSTFVHYLRICFQWGSFSGFERIVDYPKGDITYLSGDLLPI